MAGTHPSLTHNQPSMSPQSSGDTGTAGGQLNNADLSPYARQLPIDLRPQVSPMFKAWSISSCTGQG